MKLKKYRIKKIHWKFRFFNFIKTWKKSSHRAPRRMREIGAQLFGDLRRQAEGVISGKINEELDEKIKCKFEWSMLEARGITR